MNPGKNKGCGKRRLRRIADRHGIPEDDIRAMSRFDPTSTNKFIGWIAEQVSSGEITLPSDGPAINAVLNDFRRKGKLTGIPDIWKWTFSELKDRLAATKSKGEIVRIMVSGGQKTVLDLAHWRIIEITTAAAASKLCRPEWCIKDSKHWKTYGCGSDNPAYLVLRDGLKYACIVPHKGELKNVKNNPLKPTKMFARILRKLIPQMNVAWTSNFLEFEHLLRTIEEIMANPESALYYAYHVIKSRWPEAEPAIATDPEWAYCYANYVIKGRWPEAEPIIATNPEQAYLYAHYIIKGRWPEAEPAIATYPMRACDYARHVINGRWPEAEPVIADSYWAYHYALDVIKGRWPEGESHIASNPMQAYNYACNVVKGRWPKGEPAIVKLSAAYLSRYAAFSGHPSWADKHLPATRTPNKADTRAYMDLRCAARYNVT